MAKWRGPFIWNSFQALKSNLSDGYNFGDISAAWAGFDRNPSEDSNKVEQAKILGEVINDSREEYLEDREHTEEREDTAYQRAVSDMRAAGLNPYTIGASPASSSSSQVGENSIASKVQVLGYILDLQNLDFKNRKLVNDSITGVIKAIA